MKRKEKNLSASETERLEFKRAEQLWFSLQDDEEEVSLMLPQGGAAKPHMEPEHGGTIRGEDHTAAETHPELRSVCSVWRGYSTEFSSVRCRVMIYMS